MSEISTPKIDLRGFIEPNNNVSAILGIVLNLFLIFLVFYKTNSRLTDYRPILLQKIFIDLFYNIVNVITKTQFDYKNGYFFVMLSGPLENATSPTINYLTSIWILALCLDLTGVPVQYLFRYILIVRDHTVSAANYLLMLLVAFVVTLIYCIGFFKIFWTNPIIYEHAKPLLENDSFYFHGVPNFVVSHISDFRLHILFVYFYCVIFIGYAIIIYLGITVRKKLNEKRNEMSELTLDIHKQIEATLIIQAVLPCILCFIPMTIAITMTQLETNCPGLGIIVSLVLSWMPTINSIVSMLVIRTYRFQLVKIFCCKMGFCSKKVVPETSQQLEVSEI